MPRNPTIKGKIEKKTNPEDAWCIDVLNGLIHITQTGKITEYDLSEDLNIKYKIGNITGDLRIGNFERLTEKNQEYITKLLKLNHENLFI